MTLNASSTASTAAGPAVCLERVSRLFGSFVALRDVSLALPAGSSVVLLGPNGAGKSTLLQLLAGLVEPSYGTVAIFGRAPRSLRGQIAYMGHQTMLYDDLTGPENLRYMLHLHQPTLGRPEATAAVDSALEQVALDPRNPRRLGEYSQGMRQRASLARVLLGAPTLLLLDEPFSNLDVRSADAMVERLRGWLAEDEAGALGRTLLLTTHQAQLAQTLARQTLLLEEGSIRSLHATPHLPDPRGAHAPAGTTR